MQTLSQQYELTGDRDALHVGSWPSPAQLKTMDIYQIRWIKPEELFEPYNEYIKTRGDPQTNGLGHTVRPGLGGMQMVKVWTSGSWKKEVSLIKQAVRETMIDDGSDALAQRFSGSRFNGLIGRLGGAGMAPAPLASGPVPTGAPEPHRAPAAVAPQPQVQNPPSTPMNHMSAMDLFCEGMDVFGEGIFGISPSPTLAIPGAASSPSAIAASPAEVPAPAKQQNRKRGAKATDPIHTQRCEDFCIKERQAEA